MKEAEATMTLAPSARALQRPGARPRLAHAGQRQRGAAARTGRVRRGGRDPVTVHHHRLLAPFASVSCRGGDPNRPVSRPAGRSARALGPVLRRRLRLPHLRVTLVPFPVRLPAPAGADGHGAAGFQLHALAAWVLFAMWPFTRLVHVFSAPVGYLFRRYVVYRSRAAGSWVRAPRRGWER